MVLLSRGASVWVEVDGVRAQEYNVNALNKDGVETGACTIEAIEGKEFVIRYQHIPMLPGCLTKTTAYIDGIKACNYHDCLFVPQSTLKLYTIEGFPEKRTGTEQTFRAFLFGKMPTTHIGSPKDMPQEVLTGACTLRLDFDVHKRIGEINHCATVSRLFPVPSQTVIHEDCKPAFWGLSTRPGQMKKQAVGATCNCSIDQTAILKQSFIFKYRSHGLLVAEGLKEATVAVRAPSVSVEGAHVGQEVRIGAEQMESTTSRRRGRMELLPNARNVRMKREDTVKTEGTILDEEIIDQPSRMTLDISDAGDGYKVIGPKTETIVIKDDSDEED